MKKVFSIQCSVFRSSRSVVRRRWSLGRWFGLRISGKPTSGPLLCCSVRLRHSDFGLRICAVLLLLASTAIRAAIPDRPEKLTFPALNYEPPAPEKFRVALKSGPVAYVVADRELPLVNIMVSVHTGQYLEPDGKQGLSDLTGYLLARGGT